MCQAQLGVRLISGTSLAGLVRPCIRDRLTSTEDVDLTSASLQDVPLGPANVGDMDVSVVGP